MTTSTLVMLLGIASSITLVISALSVHRKRLLSFGIATGAIVALQYALVGSWVGMVTLAIGLVWTIMMLFATKHTWLNHPLFVPLFMTFHVISFVTLSDWTSMTWVNFIPLVGGWGAIISLYFKEMIYTKMTLIAFGIMWLVYEYHSAIYGQMIGEGLNLIGNTAALVTLLAARKQGIPEVLIENVDTHIIETITSSIPTITSSIKTITSSIHLPQVNKVQTASIYTNPDSGLN